MTAKEKVLYALKTHPGEYISGEELAGQLGVTRAAVWKAIRSLSKEGCRIEAVRNRGYRLIEESDRISEAGVRAFLGMDDCTVRVVEQTDSTNLEARRLLMEQEINRGLIAANTQSGGRGRYGSSFYSPADTGVYMTVILHVERRVEEFLTVTAATAVAVARVIEKVSQEKPQIKWMNDIWIDGKKAAGILTDAISSFESGMLEYLIIGIGLNITTTEFPDEIAKSAASLRSVRVSRNELIARIAREVFSLASHPADREILDEYRSRSMILGREITWEQDGRVHAGRACGITDQGCLEVECDGRRRILHTGAVHIRPQKMTEYEGETKK